MLPSSTCLTALCLLTSVSWLRAEVPAEIGTFLENRCAQCHDADEKKGRLDLDALSFDLKDPKAFAMWIKIHDRTAEHEMPPKKKPQPAPAEVDAFLKSLSSALVSADHERASSEG